MSNYIIKKKNLFIYIIILFILYVFKKMLQVKCHLGPIPIFGGLYIKIGAILPRVLENVFTEKEKQT